jgi:hypothetical protein
MAKKKRRSIVGTLEEATGDVANALSVAATGSEIGVLELAAEEELRPVRSKRTGGRKTVAKKKRAVKKSKRASRKKRT